MHRTKKMCFFSPQFNNSFLLHFWADLNLLILSIQIAEMSVLFRSECREWPLGIITGYRIAKYSYFLASHFAYIMIVGHSHSQWNKLELTIPLVIWGFRWRISSYFYLGHAIRLSTIRVKRNIASWLFYCVYYKKRVYNSEINLDSITKHKKVDTLSKQIFNSN